MVMSKVVPAIQELIDSLKGNLREADELECQAIVAITADTALQKAYEDSTLSWVGLLDEKPILAFGVAPSILSTYGVPWLLATNDIEKAGFPVIRQSKQYIEKMLSIYDNLFNYVDARNTISIRWLIWCDFNIEARSKSFGAGQYPFYKFWTTKEIWGKKQCVQSQQQL